MDKNKYLYCPKCGCEYREGFKTCNDCNVDLVDTKPEKKLANDSDEPLSNQKWIKLLENIGDIEADMIISLLEYYDIKAKKYHKGDTQYISLFMGAVNSGVYLIVEESKYEKAKEILKAEVDIDKLYE